MDHSTDIAQATTKEGELQFRLQYSKAASNYVIKPVKEAKTYNFRRELMAGIEERCRKGPSLRSLLAEDRQAAKDVHSTTIGEHAGVKPNNQECIKRHLSRFPDDK